MVLFTSMNLKDSRSARICSSDFPELFVRVFDHAELREKHREAAHEGFRVCEDETKRIEGLGVLEKLQRRHAGEVAQRAQRGRNPGKNREIEGEEERRGAEFQLAEDAEGQLVRVGNELPVLRRPSSMVREKERPGSKDDRRGRDAERECDLDDASEEDFVVGEEEIPSGLWRPPDVILLLFFEVYY